MFSTKELAAASGAVSSSPLLIQRRSCYTPEQEIKLTELQKENMALKIHEKAMERHGGVTAESHVGVMMRLLPGGKQTRETGKHTNRVLDEDEQRETTTRKSRPMELPTTKVLL